MTARGPVDPTRQGIAALAPDGQLASAEPVTVEQALVAVAGWLESGMPLFGLHQIAVALAGEVERLDGVRDDNNVLHARAHVAEAELARLRGALPEVIGCALRRGIDCDMDSVRFARQCCTIRHRMIRAGLLPPSAPEQREDGA